MQARLELIRFPAVFFVAVFALAAALSLGAVLGYTLKPSTQVVVVQKPAAASTVDSGCVWVDGKKAC